MAVGNEDNGQPAPQSAVLAQRHPDRCMLSKGQVNGRQRGSSPTVRSKEWAQVGLANGQLKNNQQTGRT